MGDTEETQLDHIGTELTTQRLEHEIEEAAKETAEVVEELTETVEELAEVVEEIVERPPDLTIIDSPPIDYDLVADKVAERLKPPEPVEAETEEEVETESETHDDYEPPEHKSFLYGKRL